MKRFLSSILALCLVSILAISANVSDQFKFEDQDDIANHSQYNLSEKLDSIYTFSMVGSKSSPYRKIYFVRDKWGNIISETSFWNNGKDWLTEYKNIAKYDLNNNITLSEKYWAQSETGILEGETKDVTHYDVGGRKIKQVKYAWEKNDWKPSNKIIFKYSDDSESEVSLVSQEIHFRRKSSKWVESDKYDITYDDQGNYKSYASLKYHRGRWIEVEKVIFNSSHNSQNIEKLYYTNSGSGLVLNEKVISIYNDDFTELEYTEYIRDDEDWAKVFHSAYGYDNKGNEISSVDYDWNGKQWFKSHMRTFNYDSLGHRNSETHYSWNGERWTGNTKKIWTFNTSGDLLASEYYGWDNQIQSWLKGGVLEKFTFDKYAADADMGYDSKLVPTNKNFKYRLKEHVTFNFQNNAYNMSEKIIYYYSDFTNSTQSNLQLNASLFPNFTTDL